MFDDQHVFGGDLRDLDLMPGQCIKHQAFKRFPDSAGTHSHGLGLMFDGIHRPCHGIDGLIQGFEKRIQHVDRRPFGHEIDFKIRHGQSAGQVFEQQCDIGGIVQAHGNGKPVFTAFSGEPVVKLCYLFPERFLQ